MRYYPALKLKMGTWDYFMCKMPMRDIAAEIHLAEDVSHGKSINEAIQRTILKGRAKGPIVNFLRNQEERFFNSLVVAALGGEPTFYPIEVNDPKFEMVEDTFTDTFGMLRLNEERDLKLYALDGQHRLFAIKEIIDSRDEPSGFSYETMSVAFVIPPAGQEIDEFRKSYRRLFSNLNRHAKPTNKLTNIIMDEDDRFAILTRLLVSDFEFFQWDGEETSVRKVDCDNGSDVMHATSQSFCNLYNLYKMNVHLLWDKTFIDDFGVISFSATKPQYQNQASEEEIEYLYKHLERIWDALLIVLPDLNKEPPEMRNHSNLKIIKEGNAPKEDSALFWPITQYLFARLARRLMNERGVDRESSTDEIIKVLKPLSSIPWSLRHPLWRHLILIPDDQGNMLMASEQKDKRLDVAYQVLLWIVGEEDLSDDLLYDMRQKWAAYLIPQQSKEYEEATFVELGNIREKILSD